MAKDFSIETPEDRGSNKNVFLVLLKNQQTNK